MLKLKLWNDCFKRWPSYIYHGVGGHKLKVKYNEAYYAWCDDVMIIHVVAAVKCKDGMIGAEKCRDVMIAAMKCRDVMIFM